MDSSQLSLPSPPPPMTAQQPTASNWDLYCMQAEVRPEIQADLFRAVSESKVVLLLDDSGSMLTPVRAPGSNQFAPATATRWSNLMTDAANIVQLVTAITPQGIDVHFMNRAGLFGVTDPSQLASAFLAPPSGGTPMVGSIRNLYETYRNAPGRILLVLVTDGEPSDGSYDDLFRVLMNKGSSWYVSLVECSDNEEEMDYLTGWDFKIPRFHNQEDYAEELRLVRSVQGLSTQFTRANYVQMILLSPIYPKYAVDIRRAGGKAVPNVFAGQSAISTSNAQYVPPPSAPPPVIQQQFIPQQPSAPPQPAPQAYATPAFRPQQSAPQQPYTVSSMSAPPTAPNVPMSAWDLYCVQAEVRPDVKNDLYNAIMYSKIVLLLDDSGSMNSIVRPPPGANARPNMPSTPTRWSELMGDTADIVRLVTAVNPQGIDVHFMNRDGMLGVTDVSQLGPLFARPPSGVTPMISLFRRMYDMYCSVQGRVLLVLVTDGEPSDGNYSDLFNVLQNKPPQFYISLVECNDNAEEMEYLSGWDLKIPRFHNQEDYGEELNLVRRAQGPSAKFTRSNYVQMIILSPIYPRYAIDIRQRGGVSVNGDCCSIL